MVFQVSISDQIFDDGRTVGRTDGRSDDGTFGLPWHRVVSILFFDPLPRLGSFLARCFVASEKKNLYMYPKTNKQKINTNNITNKQTNLKDFANWKGGAGKDPNAPGKTPMRQETVQNPEINSTPPKFWRTFWLTKLVFTRNKNLWLTFWLTNDSFYEK